MSKTSFTGLPNRPPMRKMQQCYLFLFVPFDCQELFGWICRFKWQSSGTARYTCTKERCRIHVCALSLNKSFQFQSARRFQKHRRQLRRSSLHKRSLSWHKAFTSTSLWLAQPSSHREYPMQSQKWGARHSERGVTYIKCSCFTLREKKKIKFSDSFTFLYTMLWYRCRMHLLMHESSSVRTLCRNINALWIAALSGWENTVYSFFSHSRTVNHPHWKDLIRGHTVTTFHLASDWMPNASFRKKPKSLLVGERVTTGNLILLWVLLGQKVCTNNFLERNWWWMLSLYIHFKWLWIQVKPGGGGETMI